MTASEQFNEDIKQAFEKVEKIKQGLEQFQSEQKLDSKNWGYCGTLEYINSELDNVIEILN